MNNARRGAKNRTKTIGLIMEYPWVEIATFIETRYP
jgi:hypothetical protein